jgi:tetratricopeptide (TPR) repeat protein
MNERPLSFEDPAGGDEDGYRLCVELISLGELRAAVDYMRRKVNRARKSLPADSRMHLRLLSQYAEILEITQTYGEAEYLRAKAVEIAATGSVSSEDTVDAYLKYGVLLSRNHNYQAAIPPLKEAIRRAEALDELTPLEQQLILAKSWRALQQAYEGLGELSLASEALDALENSKRLIRYLIFSMSR